jgi:diguanylate cyclase (GGDEF)-like protein
LWRSPDARHREQYLREVRLAKETLVPTKVLIVDDEEVVCKLFAEMLKHYGYHTVTVTDGSKIVERLWEEHFDVVLLDLVMPSFSGLELLRQIKQYNENLPVVIVTGYGSIETAVESMQAGAADFVTKPVEAAVLEVRIKRAIEYAHTKRLANTDSLTGLCNRRYFQERLEQEVDRAIRYHRPLSLIMIDIDHFKLYNDTHGHLQGDNVLVEVAQALEAFSRASDIVARYGGEEFALILPETDKANAEALGRRLREYVEQQTIAGVEYLPTKALTISVGIASYTPPDTKEALINAADTALYHAKREGRNRVVVWQRSMILQPHAGTS